MAQWNRCYESEREACESRLIARRCGLDALGSDEYRVLLASLDEAEQEGKGVTHS